MYGAVEFIAELMMQAQINYAAYLSLTNPNMATGFAIDFASKCNAIANYISTLPKKNFDIARAAISESLRPTIINKCDNERNVKTSNQNCANSVLNFYATKYVDYLLFTVISYAPLSLDEKNDHGSMGYNREFVQAQSKDTHLFFRLLYGCNQGWDGTILSRVTEIGRSDSYNRCERMVKWGSGYYQQWYGNVLNTNHGLATNYLRTNAAQSTAVVVRRLMYLALFGWVTIETNSFSTCLSYG